MAVTKIIVDLKLSIEDLLESIPRDGARYHESDKDARLRRNSQLADLQRVLADTNLWERTLVEPELLNIDVHRIFHDSGLLDEKSEDAGLYQFQNCLYAVSGRYSIEQDKLLVQEEFDAERQKFERLKRKFADRETTDEKMSRQSIPEVVRISVWRRDGGICCRCGSRERLEYDHIVPVSRGGSNTARNIELLCEDCNRKKSNHIQ